MTDARRLALVRAAHTVIYVVMASSVFAVFYAGVFGASGPWLWTALGLVAIETVVFVSSGMKCPMTAMATKAGAKPGADTFFPERITRHTLAFFGPLIGVSIALLAARWLGILH
ncbi:MAG: hypothetical protein WDM79_07430 [Terricaulis sp.]